MAVRCLIVDDSESFLEAARGLLEQDGISVVGVASTGAQAVQRAEELRPDVVLVDISLGDESGFAVARELADGRRRATPEVILISTHTEVDFADLIAASPAVGFLSKSRLTARAVRDLLSGPRGR